MTEENISTNSTNSLELTGESPDKEIYNKLRDAEDRRLLGLWCVLRNAIIYESGTPNPELLDGLFAGEFNLAYSILSAVVKRYLDGFAVKVRQIRDDANCWQSRESILEVVSTTKNPELIVGPGSRFLAVLSDADYGLDLWIWDLNVTR